MTTMIEHTKDEDCTLDPETDTCRECGVWHAEPCLDCGGRGFHGDDCPELARESGGEGR